MQTLKKTADILGHLNGRTEKHGDEKVPAFDVRFSCLLTRNQVNKLTGDDQMWTRWFDESKTDGDKPGMQHWAPYAWKAKFEESSVLVRVGLNDREINLGTVTLKRFVFTPIDGGQTKLEFSAGGLVNTKNVDILLFIGYEQAAIEVTFGEQIITSQEQLDLDDTGDDDKVDDAPKNAFGENEQPTVN